MFDQVFQYHGVEIALEKLDPFGWRAGQDDFREGAFVVVGVECVPQAGFVLFQMGFCVDATETAIFVERERIGLVFQWIAS